MENQSILTTSHLDDGDGRRAPMGDRTSREIVVEKRPFGLVLALAVVGTVASVVVTTTQKAQSTSTVVHIENDSSTHHALLEADGEATTHNDPLDHILHSDGTSGDLGDQNQDLDCDDDVSDEDSLDSDADAIDDMEPDSAATGGHRILTSTRAGEL
ncbi:hypothetical protein DYB32_010331 [Aphanomyces invadans]|nr:hypothetical protein DYB32_010331 [Aphanomyces invadans]